MEDTSDIHIVSLMYKLKTSSKDSDDLPIDFDRSRNKRRNELAQNKNIKGNNHFRIMLKDIVGFADCQVEAT